MTPSSYLSVSYRSDVCYLELVEGLGTPGDHAAPEAEAVMTGGEPQGELWPLLPQGADLASHTHVRG